MSREMAELEDSGSIGNHDGIGMSNEPKPTEFPQAKSSSTVLKLEGNRNCTNLVCFQAFKTRLISRLPLPLQHIIAQLKHRELAYITAALLFTSFILLLLVALSLPITKSIYLFSLDAVPETAEPSTVATDQLRFGVWGYCISSEVNVLPNNTVPVCTTPQLGYQLPSSLISLTGEPTLINALLEVILIILVFHPIAAGLSLLTLIPALFLGHHRSEVAALILAIITALFTGLSCGIDIGIVVVARNLVPSVTNNAYAVNWGPAPWMAFAAVILTWMSVIILSVVVCRCCGLSRGEKKTSLGTDVL